MAARSSGIFPREGFNLDNAFQLDDSGSSVAPVNLRHCRTIRITQVNSVLTNDALLAIELYGKIVAQYDAAGLEAAKDANGVVIIHVRGHNLPTGSEIVSYAVVPGTTGSFTTDGIFVELVDGPAR
jgi:hypothetical protein